MKKILWFSILLVIFCNKSPIGEDELSLRGDFSGKSLYLTLFNSFTESKKIPLGTSSNLVLGKNADYEARILLKFSFSDTSYQGLDEIKLIMRLNNTFKNDTLKYNIHLLSIPFTESEATWQLRNNSEAWDSAGGDYDSDSLRYGEIKGDSLIVYFNYIELNQIENAQGLIIIPQDTGFVQFYSREGGNAAVIQLVKNGTVSTVPLGNDCHIVNGPLPLYIENWLGAGIASRNFVLFNYDSLLSGVRSIYGELMFKMERSFAMRDSVEIGVKVLNEPIAGSGYDAETGPLIALKRVSINDTVCTLDIVKYVQKIINYPDSNFGFFVYLSPEHYDIATIKVRKNSYSLKVGYVEPPFER